MTCHQVEKLIPLYVSRDLEERRERLLEAHLQLCAGCVATATEYRETRQMLQEFASSTFGQDVYAEIRQNVWRQIETESISPSLSELVSSWFRPRLVWATVAVLLIAFAAIGIYFMENRGIDPQPLVSDRPKVSPKIGNETPPKQADKEALNPALASNEESRPRLGSKRQIHQRINRKAMLVQTDSIAINSSGTTSKPTQPRSTLISVPQSDSALDNDSTKSLRLELQTKNPNIRIIWFSQRDSKQTSPNLKG